MKEKLHRILSFSMAVLVLLSTMSFTIDMHYCGDTLVDTAIFKKAETCGMEMQKSTSPSECSFTKKDCCSEEQFVINGQDELKISFDTLTADQQLFVASFVYSYIQLFEGLEENVTLYKDYDPLLVSRQIYKLDETYLI